MRADSAKLCVVEPAPGGKAVSMYLSVGLAVSDGEFCGLLSRISPHPVNNVGRQGLVQAVLIEGD